jgi:hypothetical protein
MTSGSRRIRFDQPGTQAAFDSAFADIVFTVARRDQLDQAIEAMEQQVSSLQSSTGCAAYEESRL